MIVRRIVYGMAFVALFVAAPIHGHQFWCNLLTFALPGFAIGVGIGRFSEARKGQLMTYTHKARLWFDRNVAVLYMLVAVLALAGITAAASATITNVRQDRCFDEYAAASAKTSKAVRDASVVVADDTTVRDRALNEMFLFLATDPPDGSVEGARLFSELLVANGDLVKSQQALAKVREANPVPGPPSTFCD